MKLESCVSSLSCENTHFSLGLTFISDSHGTRDSGPPTREWVMTRTTSIMKTHGFSTQVSLCLDVLANFLFCHFRIARNTSWGNLEACIQTGTSSGEGWFQPTTSTSLFDCGVAPDSYVNQNDLGDSGGKVPRTHTMTHKWVKPWGVETREWLASWVQRPQPIPLKFYQQHGFDKCEFFCALPFFGIVK